MLRIIRILLLAAACTLCATACGDNMPSGEGRVPGDESQDASSPDPSVEPTLSILSQTLLEFGPEAAEATVSFESNTVVTAESSVVWIEVRSVSDGKVALGISENDSWGRVGKVTLRAGSLAAEVTVKQARTEGFAAIDAGLAEEPFEEAEGDVLNPERGFYYPFSLSASRPSLSASQVRSLRAQGHTVLYIQYVLPKYMSKDIPSENLENIQKDMDALREGGAKCVLRFCYKISDSSSNKPWDPEEKWVMRHIEQIKPILRRNEDVIMVFQAGFVGVWGEWYYTDHFGMDPKTPEEYAPRKRVLEAMLEALPASRQVAVRTPDFKTGIYGLSLRDTLSQATAHDGSTLSRIGAYNDCFGADSGDMGTFLGEDSRAFWEGDTRYTFMGGETCQVSDYCKCAVSVADMEKCHWSYLNIDYNGDVLSRWKKGKCMDEITRRLGYRIVMERVLHTPAPQAGEPCTVVLYFRNDGFSAFQNPRDARLIFVASDGSKTAFDLGSDPRTWHSGIHRVEKTFDLPASSGTLWLHLADPLLPDRPEFSAALANKGVWDSSTGWNKILEIKRN